jgi:NADH dehydrogenase [ubiquinone] 1 alpha subcomplex assembly factor 5
MNDAMALFDPAAVRRHRQRAEAAMGDHDFLYREVADRLVERLGDMRRDFGPAVLLDDHGGVLASALEGGVGDIRQCDPDGDEPFGADGGADLVASLLSLHWINDLPGVLARGRRVLRPDGLFMAALFGAGTLTELRESWAVAEAAEEGGVSPRVAPFAEVRDAGALLQRAGFALPMADMDVITVDYPDAFALMGDLRGMGETNALHQRRKTFTRRATLMAMAEAYKARFSDADGRIPATFQVLWLTAWAPDTSQQKPLTPGSAKSRLADALDATERPAGDKAEP